MLKNRLLVIGVLLFAIGISVCVFFGGNLLPLVVVLLGVLCIALCSVRFFGKSLNLKVIIVFSLLPVIGFAYCALYRNLFILPFNAYTNKLVTVSGTVTDISSYGDSLSYDIRVTSSDSLPSGTVLRIFTSLDDELIDKYDPVSVKAVLKSALNKPTLTGNGIILYGSGSIKQNGKSGLLNSLYNRVQDTAQAVLPFDAAALFSALTLGDSSMISQETYYSFQRSGIAHILAVSGLHMTVLATALYSLLSRTGANRFVSLFLCSALCLLICLLNGFQASAVRAAIMFLFFICGRTFYKSVDSVTSLFAALGLLILVNPFSIASLSLQLSFLATLGILSFWELLPRFSIKNKFLRLLFNVFVTPAVFSAAAMLFTLPVTLYSFDCVSVLSFFSNIALGIIFPPLLILCFILALTSLFSFGLTAVVAFPVILLSDILHKVSGFFASLDFAVFSADIPGKSAVMLLAVLFMVCVLLLRKRIRLYTCGILFLLCIGFTVYGTVAKEAILNNGILISARSTYNESCFLIFEDNIATLIDHDAKSGIQSLVVKNGVKAIDNYVLTSYNNNSADKIKFFINNFHLKNIFVPDAENVSNQKIYSEIALIAASSGCQLNVLRDMNSINNVIILQKDDSFAAICQAYGKNHILTNGYSFDESIYNGTALYLTSEKAVYSSFDDCMFCIYEGNSDTSAVSYSFDEYVTVFINEEKLEVNINER